MEAVYRINDLKQLRALTHPLRIQLLEKLLEQPRTAAQLSSLLHESVNKIYYHLTELERHGLVRVVKTQQKGNLVERYYQPVARFFRVDEGLFHRGSEGREAFHQSLLVLLEAAALDLRRAFHSGQLTAEDLGRISRCYLRVRIPPEKLEPFRRKVESLIEEFKALEDPGAPTQATLTLVFYPWKEPVSSTAQEGGAEKEWSKGEEGGGGISAGTVGFP